MMKTTLLLALAAACAEPAPANPTWEDVRPILMANCVRCHGDPSLGATPSRFRLDVFHQDPNSGDRGAASMAEFIVARAVHRGDMPPIGPTLSERQHEILEKWAVSKLIGSSPGEPTATLLSGGGATIDQTATFVVDVRHPDGGGVAGVLTFDGRPIARLRSGRNTIVWDAGTQPAVIAPLAAELYIETEEVLAPTSVVVDLAELEVDHGAQEYAPTINLTYPTVEALFHDADDPALRTIGYSVIAAFDVSVDFTAVRADEEVVLAADVAIPAGTPANMQPDVVIDPTLLGEGRWRLRVTADDGTQTRTVESGTFYVFHETGGPTWGDVAPIFEAKCAGCHLGAQDGNRVDFGPDLTSMADAIGLRGSIYHRVVVTRDMPAPSAEEIVPGFTPMTDAERATIADWIRSGAQP